MHNIAERNVLLRALSELPTGCKIATDEFREGWHFMRTGGAGRLEKKVRTLGWNFLKISDGDLRSGVGASSQDAIGNALKLALRRVPPHSNAVELQRIEITQYPWFFLARIQVYPYRIQESVSCPIPLEVLAMEPSRQRRLSPQSAELYPHFASAMPMLKEMLLASRNAEARP